MSVEKFLEKSELELYTQKLKTHLNKRMKYIASVPLIPDGKTERTDWNDLINYTGTNYCMRGDVFELIGNTEHHYIDFKYYEYTRFYNRDLVVVLFDVKKKEDGTLENDIQVRKLVSRLDDYDEKTIIGLDETRGYPSVHTKIGGWKQEDEVDMIFIGDAPFVANSEEVVDSKSWKITYNYDKIYCEYNGSNIIKGSTFTFPEMKYEDAASTTVTIPSEDYVCVSKTATGPVFVFKSTTTENTITLTFAGTERFYHLEKVEILLYNYYTTHPTVNNIRVEDAASRIVTIESDAIHFVNNDYIEIDSRTMAKYDDDNTEEPNKMLSAKSAVETEKLSTITTPLTEVIYRLTTDETISGKSYKAGLYVWDSKVATPMWIRVGGNVVDEKTILSEDEDGNGTPLHTAVGGWKEIDKEPSESADILAGVTFVKSVEPGDMHILSAAITTTETICTGNRDYFMVGLAADDGTYYDGKLKFIDKTSSQIIYADNEDLTQVKVAAIVRENNRVEMMMLVTDAATSMTRQEAIAYTFDEPIYHPLESKFICIDNRTMVNDTTDTTKETGVLKAKSAVDVTNLYLTNVDNNVLYRLTADTTYWGKNYAAGYYTCDKTKSPIEWTKFSALETDGKTLLWKDEDSNTIPLKTAIGGWKEECVSDLAFKNVPSGAFMSTSGNDLIAKYTDSAMICSNNKFLNIGAVIDAGKFKVLDTDGNTHTINAERYICTELKSEGLIGTFKSEDSDNYITFKWSPSNYLYELSFTFKDYLTTVPNVAAITATEQIQSAYGTLYSYVDTAFIPTNETVSRKTVYRRGKDTYVELGAKSAIEVEKLSTITSPLTEVIYRLTEEETISGTKYAKGLYVYDTTGAVHGWISVGGNEVDEKTILSTDEDGEPTAIHTAIGGWSTTIKNDLKFKTIPSTAEYIFSSDNDWCIQWTSNSMESSDKNFLKIGAIIEVGNMVFDEVGGGVTHFISKDSFVCYELQTSGMVGNFISERTGNRLQFKWNPSDYFHLFRIYLTDGVTKYPSGIENAAFEEQIRAAYHMDVHYADSRYLEVDKNTISLIDNESTTERNFVIGAKSAVETNKLSTITSPLTEVIYRLTNEETISGTKYPVGLYVYDKTSYKWISVGGSEVDEFTILSTNESDEKVPLHTAIGGGIKRTETKIIPKTVPLSLYSTTWSGTYAVYGDSMLFDVADNNFLKIGATLTIGSINFKDADGIYRTIPDETFVCNMIETPATGRTDGHFISTTTNNGATIVYIDGNFTTLSISLPGLDEKYPTPFTDFTLFRNNIKAYYDELKYADNKFLNVDRKTIRDVNEFGETSPLHTEIGGYTDFNYKFTESANILEGQTFTIEEYGGKYYGIAEFTSVPKCTREEDYVKVSFEFSDGSKLEKNLKHRLTEETVHCYADDYSEERWTSVCEFLEDTDGVLCEVLMPGAGVTITKQSAICCTVSSDVVYHHINSNFINVDNTTIILDKEDYEVDTWKLKAKSAIEVTTLPNAYDAVKECIYHLRENTPAHDAGFYVAFKKDSATAWDWITVGASDVKLKENGGLAFNSDKELHVVAGTGIQTIADGTCVKPNSDKGIKVDKDGVAVNVYPLEGALTFKYGMLAVNTLPQTGNIAVDDSVEPGFLTVYTSKGLERTTSGLTVKLADATLSCTDTGLSVKTAPNAGLERNSVDGLYVNAINGLLISDNKLNVRAGNGITVDTNGVSVKPYAGITVDSSGVGVNILRTDSTTTENVNSGLRFVNNYLKINPGNGLTIPGASNLLTVKVADSSINCTTSGLAVNLAPTGGLISGSAGIYVNAGTGLARSGGVVVAKAYKGITVDSNGISTKLVSDGGLSVSDSGMYVKLTTISGLNIDSNGLCVKNGNGINVDSTGISVKAGSGITVDANGVAAKVRSTGGLDIASDGLMVKFAATSGLGSEGTGLYVKIGNGLQKNTSGVSVKLNSTYSGLTCDSNGLALTTKYSSGTALPESGTSGEIFFKYV